MEKALKAKGHVIETLHGYDSLDGEVLSLFDAWSNVASNALAAAIVNAHAVLDTEKIVIDGTLPPAELTKLITKTKARLHDYDLTGLRFPEFEQGMIGYEARALGGAFLPVYAKFAPDRDVFLKMISRQQRITQSVLQPGT